MNSGKSWPDSTFVWETEDQPHPCGSHWDPFYESPREALGSMPEILTQSIPFSTFEQRYPGPCEVPGSWTKGAYLTWPSGNLGLIATLRTIERRTELVNVHPFTQYGKQVTMSIERVHVWSSGAKAQIECGWGESTVSFFDLTFLGSRSWYEAGKTCDFILTGIAYDAKPASLEPIVLDQDSAGAEILREGLGLADGGDLALGVEELSVFMRVEEWDRDDYWFRGPVRVVKDLDDWLGQSGWRVRVCVMQMDSEDAELDIFITSRVWSSEEPPQVGQDIEGTLWLQGRLWWASWSAP